MPIFKSQEQWFSEKDIPGERFKKIKHNFSIKRLIYQGKTFFQKALIFDNSVYGRIFCLDEIIQFSEKDEFIYHEMMVHPILFSHPNPKNILIIGGGDGGALREVLKHSVEKVDIVEIDKKVIEISKKYLKFVNQGSFSDRRVKEYNLSGEKFIQEHKNQYDIVIIDCTNFGEGKISDALYSVNFYKKVFSSLKKEGIVITLGSSFLDFENFIKPIFKKINKVFIYSTIIKYCMASYNCGEYSFIVGSKKINLEKVNFNKIRNRFNKIDKKYNLRYYSPDIHKASMVLPKIWKIK